MSLTYIHTPDLLRERSLTRVEVTRPVSGGMAAVRLDVSGGHERPAVRAMVISLDDRGARVCLVPDGALLLAGDHVRIEIHVGAGARLEIIEPAGTVAYPMADGTHANWDIVINLEPAATLIWAGEPFVVAADADVRRSTEITLGWDARLALRELLVLGRDGEHGGRLWQETSASGANGRPLLAESLEVGPESSRLLLGGARVIGSIIVLGDDLPELAPSRSVTSMPLDSGGGLIRCLASAAHEAALREPWAATRPRFVA